MYSNWQMYYNIIMVLLKKPCTRAEKFQVFWDSELDLSHQQLDSDTTPAGLGLDLVLPSRIRTKLETCRT